MRRGFAILCLLIVMGGFGAVASSAAGRTYCGTFRARHHKLYAYVLRGRVGCREARGTLRAWFVDAHHTQRYGRWVCFDSLGSALRRGEIQHCSTRSRAVIADYSHRL